MKGYQIKEQLNHNIFIPYIIRHLQVSKVQRKSRIKTCGYYRLFCLSFSSRKIRHSNDQRGEKRFEFKYLLCSLRSDTKIPWKLICNWTFSLENIIESSFPPTPCQPAVTVNKSWTIGTQSTQWLRYVTLWLQPKMTVFKEEKIL